MLISLYFLKALNLLSIFQKHKHVWSIYIEPLHYFVPEYLKIHQVTLIYITIKEINLASIFYFIQVVQINHKEHPMLILHRFLQTVRRNLEELLFQ